MTEYIKIAIETINDNHRSGPKFVLWEDIREHAKKNALLYMCVNKVGDAEAVALVDFTIMKTGEEGCLISNDGIWFNRLQDKIDLKTLKNAVSDKKNLTFTFKNSENIGIKIGKPAAYIAEVTNEIIRLRDGGEPKLKEKDETPKDPDIVIVQKPKNNPFSFKL